MAYAASYSSVEYLVPDGSSNTIIDRAQNGTPILNSATVNERGVSLNNMSDFNIYDENLIINNSLDIGNSQLGGTLYANPNFTNDRTANIIINQVTSNKRTNLQGFAEIFGSRSELVIANPNGIAVKGAGFINTSRLGLVTGEAEFDEIGDLEGFALSDEGEINISGRDMLYSDGEKIFLGLDSRSVGYTDLVSHVIKITADIYAGKELNIATGNDFYDYKNKKITAKENQELPEEALAVDAVHLGAIRAGKINIIATQAGFGVKALSNLVSDLDDISINANGEMVVHQVNSHKDIDITSSAKLHNEKAIIAAGDLTIKAESVVNNENSLISGNNINLNLTNFEHYGQLLAISNLGLEIDDFTNNSVVQADGDLTIKANNLVNNDLFYAGNNLHINLANSLLNKTSSLLYAYNDMSIIVAGDVMNNQANIIAENGSLDFALQGNLTNNSAFISAGNNLTINSLNIINKRESIATSYEEEYQYIDSHRQYGEAFYRWVVEGEESKASEIRAATNIYINTNHLENRNSLIASGLDMEIYLNNLSNISNNYYSGTREYIIAKHPGYRYNRGYDCAIHWCSDGSTKWTHRGEKKNVIEHLQNASIKAGGNLTGDITGYIDNNLINSHIAYEHKLPDDFKVPEKIKLEDKVNIDVRVRGKFKRGDNLSAFGYVIETRSQFLNQYSFYSTLYWMQRFGLDPELAGIKVMGDMHYSLELVRENEMIEKLLVSRNENGDAAISYTKSLYDNALSDDFMSLGAKLGEELTEEQIANLKDDVIWLVKDKVIIDGEEEEVLAPKIYLSKESQDIIARNLHKSGSIIAAGGDLRLDIAGNFNANGGKLTSAGAMFLNAKEGEVNLLDTALESGAVAAITAKYGINIAANSSEFTSDIFGYNVSNVKDDAALARSNATFNANNDILINSLNGDINIANDQLNSSGSIFITADNGKVINDSRKISAGADLFMQAMSITNGEKLLDRSKDRALLSAAGMVSLDATSSDIANYGGLIEAGSYAYLTAGRDIINENAKNTIKSGYFTNDELRQGEIKADNVVMVAARDITNKASTINATNEIYLEAERDVNIVTDIVKNSYYFGHDKGYSSSSKTTNQESILNSVSDINIISGGNSNIFGSQIIAANSLNINAEEDVNISSVINEDRIDSEYHSRNSSVVHIQDLIHQEAKISALNGNININSLGSFTTIASDINADKGNLTLAAGDDIDILAGQNKSSYYQRSWKKSGFFGGGNSSMSQNRAITNIGSIANSGLVLRSNSGNDTNIIASDLSGEDGFIIAELGDIAIKNAIDSVKQYDARTKDGSFTKEISKIYDYQEKAKMSNLAFDNDLEITAELGDVTIQASNLDIKNDLSFGNFSIARNLDGSLKIKQDGTYETIDGGSVQNLYITTAELKNEHFEEHKSTSFNPISASITILGDIFSFGGKISVIDDMNKKIQKEVNKITNADNGAFLKKNSTKTRNLEIIASSANVNVAGDLKINASEEFKVAGSNINIGGDADINAAKIDIISVAENSSDYVNNKTIKFAEMDIGFRDSSYKSALEGRGQKNLFTKQAITQKASDINIGNNLLINSTRDIDIIAANILVNNDAIIKTGGSFNLIDAKDIEKTNSENSNIEIEMGAKIGNAYVDSYNAAMAYKDAKKNLDKSEKKLKKMQKLKEQGRASQKAVDLAYTQLALAAARLVSATVNLSNSAANSASAASSSFGTGIYGAGYMDATYHKDFLKTESDRSVGSSFIAGNNIDIDAFNEYKQVASLLASNNDNVTIEAANANIAAGENSFQSEFGSKTTNMGASFGNNGVGLSAGYNQSDNFILQNTHINSEILAERGNFNFNILGDTNIKGANIIAKQVNMNIGGDLTLETMQDSYEQQGSSYGVNLGFGMDKASLNNAAISMGIVDIYKETTKRSTGIIELASNDNNISEAKNLINLLNSDSLHISGEIVNNTVKEDMEYINSDFEGKLEIPVELFTKSGRAEMIDNLKNLDRNVATTIGGAIFNVTDSVAVAMNNVSGESDKGLVGDWKGARIKSTQGLKSYMENYDKREELTQEGYDYYDILPEEEVVKQFDILPQRKSIYHTYKLDAQGKAVNIISQGQKNYIKYIHKEKGYEIVIDSKSGTIVTDPINKGTYNHFNPSGLTNNVGHILFDIVPYVFYGNDEKIFPDSSTPTDKTWVTDRVLRTFYNPKNDNSFNLDE